MFCEDFSSFGTEKSSLQKGINEFNKKQSASLVENRIKLNKWKPGKRPLLTLSKFSIHRLINRHDLDHKNWIHKCLVIPPNVFFKKINANAAFLCNYEVMQILQQLKDNTQKKHKREGSLATVTYETVHYLQDTECKNQSTQAIQKFLEAMKQFKLTKTEKLMMVNTPPRTELEIQLIVQESEERLSEEEVRNIIKIVNECLLATDNS